MFGNNPINNIDTNGMDWYTNRFSGKQVWHDGSGWRLFASHNDDVVYQLPEVTKTEYSKEGLQQAAEDYVSTMQFEQSLNDVGIETYRTNNRLEAFANWVSVGALPEFKGLGSLFKSGKAVKTAEEAKYLFTKTIEQDNLIFYSTKVGDETIEFGGYMTKTEDVLNIKGFDIENANLKNKLGVKGINEIIQAFGKDQNVNKIIIEGARRTTGANPGRRPIPLEFIINK